MSSRHSFRKKEKVQVIAERERLRKLVKCSSVTWDNSHARFLGKVGVIQQVDRGDGTVNLKFGDRTCWLPLSALRKYSHNKGDYAGVLPTPRHHSLPLQFVPVVPVGQSSSAMPPPSRSRDYMDARPARLHQVLHKKARVADSRPRKRARITPSSIQPTTAPTPPSPFTGSRMSRLDRIFAEKKYKQMQKYMQPLRPAPQPQPPDPAPVPRARPRNSVRPPVPYSPASPKYSPSSEPPPSPNYSPSPSGNEDTSFTSYSPTSDMKDAQVVEARKRRERRAHKHGKSGKKSKQRERERKKRKRMSKEKDKKRRKSKAKLKAKKRKRKHRRKAPNPDSSESLPKWCFKGGETSQAEAFPEGTVERSVPEPALQAHPAIPTHAALASGTATPPSVQAPTPTQPPVTLVSNSSQAVSDPGAQPARPPAAGTAHDPAAASTAPYLGTVAPAPTVPPPAAVQPAPAQTQAASTLTTQVATPAPPAPAPVPVDPPSAAKAKDGSPASPVLSLANSDDDFGDFDDQDEAFHVPAEAPAVRPDSPQLDLSDSDDVGDVGAGDGSPLFKTGCNSWPDELGGQDENVDYKLKWRNLQREHNRYKITMKAKVQDLTAKLERSDMQKATAERQLTQAREEITTLTAQVGIASSTSNDLKVYHQSQEKIWKERLKNAHQSSSKNMKIMHRKLAQARLEAKTYRLRLEDNEIEVPKVDPAELRRSDSRKRKRESRSDAGQDDGMRKRYKASPKTGGKDDSFVVGDLPSLALNKRSKSSVSGKSSGSKARRKATPKQHRERKKRTLKRPAAQEDPEDTLFEPEPLGSELDDTPTKKDSDLIVPGTPRVADEHLAAPSVLPPERPSVTAEQILMSAGDSVTEPADAPKDRSPPPLPSLSDASKELAQRSPEEDPDPPFPEGTVQEPESKEILDLTTPPDPAPGPKSDEPEPEKAAAAAKYEGSKSPMKKEEAPTGPAAVEGTEAPPTSSETAPPPAQDAPTAEKAGSGGGSATAKESAKQAAKPVETATEKPNTEADAQPAAGAPAESQPGTAKPGVQLEDDDNSSNDDAPIGGGVPPQE